MWWMSSTYIRLYSLFYFEMIYKNTICYITTIFQELNRLFEHLSNNTRYQI